MDESPGRSPTVSVVTTCFNAERTIERTLRSVLEQTYPHVEYWVLDAASRDGTLGILERMRPLFGGRMHYESAPDRGIYDGFNRGILRCTGAVVGILNADDWYEPDAIENVVDAYRRHPDAGVFYGIARLVTEDGDHERALLRRHHEMLPECMLSHPAMFVTRAAYSAHGMFSLDFSIAADYELAARLRQRGVTFVPIDRVLTVVRPGGMSDRRQLHADLECATVRRRFGFVSRPRFGGLVARAWGGHVLRAVRRMAAGAAGKRAELS